jgi:hypothetical protein
VDEVAAAHAVFTRVLVHHNLHPWWWRRRRAKAEAAYLWRTRAAAAAYSPVREAVEERLAKAEAVRREQTKLAFEEQEHRLAEARVRSAVWQERQAVADRPLPGGLTPRELADRGVNPPAWPPEVRDAVGDVESWWAGLVASARNERGLTAAAQKVISAITSTAAALEAAGRPGITAVNDIPSEVIYGWWIDFDWSDLPSTEPLRTPPDIPVGHLALGDWNYELDLRDRVVLRRLYPGGYGLANVSGPWSLTPFRGLGFNNGTGPNYRWVTEDIERFAEDLIPTWITYRERHAPYVDVLRTRLPRHVDPAVYIPYVQAVAERAATAFTALVAGQE